MLKPEIALYDHQKIMVALLDEYRGFGIFAEQGTGKTLPVLWHVVKLLEQGEIETALIVAPKATMGAWSRDMALFKDEYRTLLETYVTVINYDKVWRGDKYKRAWDCIVLDESHFIKNRSSKRASFLLGLSLSAKYRYVVTGTPIGNGALEDIWSQFAFLDPLPVGRGKVGSNIFGGAYSTFSDRYCLLNRYWKPYKYLNVSELQDIISEHSYRVTKAECLDLPEKLPDEVYDIELTEKSLYKTIAKESASIKYDILCQNPLSKMLRLRQICSGFITNEKGEVIRLKTEKHKALNEFLDGYDKKLVVFANFTQSINDVAEIFKSRKIKFFVLNGTSKDKEVWKKFQSDPKVQAIIVQYQSGSQGIDLYASDTILFYEPPLSSNLLIQARDRIHRIGQHSPCSYIFFLTENTIEVAIYKALSGYADFSEKLFIEYMDEYQKSFSR